MIREIAGKQNDSVKLARKLRLKKFRRARGLVVCEGMDLLEAAAAAEVDIVEILVRAELLDRIPSRLLGCAAQSGPAKSSLDIGVCDQETLEYASALGGGVDVIFTLAQPQWGLADLRWEEGIVFFLDGVGDPGNVGTIIRSSQSFGLGGVICSPGTADAFGPKAMRAGMGSQFAVRVATDVAAEDLMRWSGNEVRKAVDESAVLVADSQGGDDAREVPLDPGTVVVLGSERGAVSAGWSAAKRVNIAQADGDSVNVAMAGTIIAYESWQRRRARGVGN